MIVPSLAKAGFRVGIFDGSPLAGCSSAETVNAYVPNMAVSCHSGGNAGASRRYRRTSRSFTSTPAAASACRAACISGSSVLGAPPKLKPAAVHRPELAADALLLDEVGRFLLGRATDLTAHDDELRLRVLLK